MESRKICRGTKMSDNKRQKCKEKMQVYSRVVGYYAPINQWNKGKAEEYTLRKTFKLKDKKHNKDTQN